MVERGKDWSIEFPIQQLDLLGGHDIFEPQKQQLLSKRIQLNAKLILTLLQDLKLLAGQTEPH